MMKNIHSLILCVLMMVASLTASAQNSKNDNADSIIGKYESSMDGKTSRVAFTKNADGTYKCQLYWASYAVDPKTGKKRLDEKNPDKSLRSVPCDQIVLINGLKYDSEKKEWNGAKVYSPDLGMKANVALKFVPDGRLSLKGSMIGISKTAYFTHTDK